MEIHTASFLVIVFHIYARSLLCLAATDFCLQPLGMERWIIGDAQITESSAYNTLTHTGKQARLNNQNCWCSLLGSTITDQWVRVDLEKPLSITGIAIQGDPNHSPNYITKFKLKFSVDGIHNFFKIDIGGTQKILDGANGENQLITRSFPTKPFAARYVEFLPTQKGPNSMNAACVRFELYGCSYVCNQGLGIESGTGLPSGFSLTASSEASGKEATKGRLSGASSWCANTNDANQHLQIDFGKVISMSGIAVQGSPTESSWVKDFYIDYGTTLASLVTYKSKGSSMLFIGNKDQNTIVVNWFGVRLTARFVRLRPRTFNGRMCLRMEVVGCDSGFVGELGAENRVLEDSRFQAGDFTAWVTNRYGPKDGRLNNDRPWGLRKTTGFIWFRVDLGRIMLVNGVSTQGDPTFAENYFKDYKLQFSLEATGHQVVTVKVESSSAQKIFSGNTNCQGVKFNFLERTPISVRFLQFLKNTEPTNDYGLRVEIYGRPQVCSDSFGMVAGEASEHQPTISVSGGAIPPSKAKINSEAAWCAGSGGTGHHFMYDLGAEKQVSGIAIQGNPSAKKWVKTFTVQYGSSSSSLTTYSVSGSNKEFVGSKSRNLIVYNWFPSEITTRYIKIIPMTSESEVCLRLNIYGCPASGCFKRIGIASSTTIGNSLLTSSTSTSANEASKGRFNSYDTWAACQVGSCSPKESSGSKPWIQLCLPTSQSISAVVIQGNGNTDNLAEVSTFAVKYSFATGGTFYDYKQQGSVKIFSVSTGRYGSVQINLPTAIAAKCIRLVIHSQTSTNRNVGLRWELLGCSPVTQKVAVAVSSTSLTIGRGNMGTITCTATGQPGLGISYKTSGNPVVDSDIHKLENEILTNSNIEGTTTRDLEITANAAAISGSYDQCAVTNAAQGLVQCQRSYECSAVYPGIPSSTGTKSFIVMVPGLLAKPQSPTGLSSNSITSTSAKVTWTASAPADFQVENYKVSIKRKQDGASVGTDQTVTGLEAIINGLTGYTEYTVELSAKSVTVNVYSDKGTHSFRTEEGAATAPVDAAATAISASSITVTWKQPASMNGILHDYQIRYKKTSATSSSSVLRVGKSLSRTVGNLSAFTDYDFQVSATTKGGTIEGAWTSIIKIKTQKGSATAPVDAAATAVSASSITVTWKQPASMNGILHDYQIRYKKTLDANFSSVLRVGLSLSRTFGNLSAFTDYDFQVSATTKEGTIEGAWTSIIKQKTQEDFPLAPQALQSITILQWSSVLKWEKPSKENGIIQNYTIKLAGKKDYNSTFSHQKLLIVPIGSGSSSSFSTNVTGLVPGSSYTAQIAASTGRGRGSYSSAIRVNTLYAAPPAAEVRKDIKSSGNITVTLNSVWNINGPINRYALAVINGTEAICADEVYKTSLLPSRIPMTLTFVPGSETIPGISFNIDTIGNFTICFRGILVNESNIMNGKAGVTSIERKTLKTIDKAKIDTDKVTESQFVIPLVPGPSGTKFYQVIVIEMAQSSQSTLPKPDNYAKETLGPYIASNTAPGTPYITAEFSSSSFSVSFTVGDGKKYSKSKRKRRSTANQEYTNVGLKADTFYSVFQRAFISEGVYYSSLWIGPLKTKSSGGGGGGGDLTYTRLIVGAVVAVIFALGLAALYFFRFRRGKTSDKGMAGKELDNFDKEIRMEPHPMANDNHIYENDEDNLTNPDTNAAASLHRKKPPIEVGHDDDHPPVSVQAFQRHFRHLQKNGSYGLSQEYNDLKKGQLYPWDIARNTVNRRKNRYANIVAYDHSRVRLEPLPGQPHSDYYNANYISSYSRPSVYIASQGPFHETEESFWRMIWDNDVPAIVMLTNVMQRGRVIQYWPDDGEMQFGDVSIRLSSMDNYVDYVTRHLSITKRGHLTAKTILHFQFLSWPAHGAPECSDLLNFRNKLRNHFPFQTEQPILVHCSAGAGRTGIFIVIDAMLELAFTQQKIDVFNYLNFIRSQRIHLIQTEEQYIFIHHALLESITCGVTEIEAQNFMIKTNQLKAKDNHGKSGYETQFERLNALTHQLLPVETSSALKPVNEDRNRRNDVLPRDSHRIFLQQSIYENDCSDYINATYVDGYKRKDAFIATEYPVPGTISDFWTMVHQKTVATVVVLNKQREGSQNYSIFWPSVGCKTSYGNIFVSNKSEDEENGSMRRIMHVRHEDLPEEIHETEFYHFPYWPDHNVPKDTTRLLSLLNRVDRSQQKHGNQSIIVMCSDGAGRTGTFIAISILLERFKTEQLIDVFQTIKKIRYFRPKFVENTVQYQFCYNMAQAYRDSFDNYSNFASY